MLMNFLRTRWKLVLIGMLFTIVLSALWAYRAEVQERAQAVAELAHAVETIHHANETIEQLKYERELVEEVLNKHRDAVQASKEQLQDDLEELHDEDADDWRSGELPDGLRERLLHDGEDRGSHQEGGDTSGSTDGTSG